MKKLFGALVVLALLLVAIPSQVEAQATVIRADGTCNINTAAGNVLFDCHVQWTFTPNGDVKSYIHGKILDGFPLPTELEHVDNASTGQICSFAAPNFTGVVTKSGVVNVTCRS